VENWKVKLASIVPQLKSYLEELLSTEAVLFGEANPPNKPGAYIIYDHQEQLAYIGEAKGSGGLKDRLLSKHLSGDDNHAIQRAYKESWPDRQQRREYIKSNIRVRWVETPDANTAVALERLAILVFDPPWNKK
jgi:excinuclease UvrABC nuclease subunit